MENIFSGLNGQLKEIKKEGWYDKRELKKLGIYSSALFNEENGLLIKKEDNQRYVLGASIIHHYNTIFSLGIEDRIEAGELALALGDLRINAHILSHPEIQSSNNGQRKKIYVEGKNLRYFKDFCNGKEVISLEDSEKSQLRIIPEFEISLGDLAYISKHKNEPSEAIAQAIKKSQWLVRGAMLKLGYQKPRSLDEIIEVSERIFYELHPKIRPWGNDVKESVRELYFFNPASYVADKLGRTEEEIEFLAKIQGLEKFGAKNEYTISEILKLSRIPYEELQQALFRGELETRIFKPDINNIDEKVGDIPVGAVLVKEESLINYFKNRGKVIHERVKTRVEKYIDGELKKREEMWDEDYVGDYARIIRGKLFCSPLHLLKAYTYKYPLPNEREDKEMGANKDTSLLARNDLIEAHFRAAISLARSNLYRAKGNLELIDLVHSAIVGEVKGATYYDRNKRVKSLTYMLWWMRHDVLREIKNNADLIRMPISMQERLEKMQKAIQYFIQNYERKPDKTELSNVSGLSAEEIRILMRLNKRIIHSLDAKIKNEDDAIINLIEDKRAEKHTKRTMDEDYRKEIRKSVMGLKNSRERNVIIWLYGLNNQDPMTLGEIGACYNISKGSIRQIEIRALRKLGYDENLRKLAGKAFAQNEKPLKKQVRNKVK